MLANSCAADLIRTRVTLQEREHNLITIDNKSYINFASSDYLGIATDPKVIKSFIQGAEKYGVGSGASPLISGYYAAQHELEQRFAQFIGRERALFFNSGYHANIGVLQVLANRNTTIIADKLCHASLLDGMQLSRAKCIRYPHHDLAKIEELTQKFANSLLVTESVFSMQGDIAPLPEIIAIAQKNHATLVIDDAHGFGVLGEHGGGICDFYSVNQEHVPCLITPLGKACGSMGCFVSGSHDFIESLIQFARSYRYSTALPPAVAHATLTALEIIASEQWRRARLNDLIILFNKKAQHLPLVSQDMTPIKAIIVGDNQRALLIQQKMQEQGYFVSCIRPPTVPVNTARIRISLNCNHQQQDIVKLLDLLQQFLI